MRNWTIFPENLYAVGEEMDKRFHEGITVTERVYEGKWTATTGGCYTEMNFIKNIKVKARGRARAVQRIFHT